MSFGDEGIRKLKTLTVFQFQNLTKNGKYCSHNGYSVTITSSLLIILYQTGVGL